MKERRCFVRYPIRGTLMLQPPNSMRPIKGELVDMSFKGMAARIKLPLDKDFLTRFLLVSKEFEVHLQGTCRIIYCEPAEGSDMYRTGMVFVKVDSETVRNLVLNLEKAFKLAIDSPGFFR